MEAVKKFKICLLVSVSGFSLSALTICFISILKTIPFESRQTAAYFIAAVFWIMLITGIVFLKLADKQRKTGGLNSVGVDKKIVQPHCGALSFGQNREAKISDAVFVVLLILTIVFSAVHMKSNSVGIVFAGLMILSFNIHSFLNGKNYQCYKLLKGRGI